MKQGCFPTPLKYTLPDDGGWDWLRDVLIPNLDCLYAGLEFMPAPQCLPPHHPPLPAVWRVAGSPGVCVRSYLEAESGP